jgi:hypothetical protein
MKRIQRDSKNMKGDIPCCAADAMRKIRQISLGGNIIGLSMLEQVFEDVAGADLTQDTDIRRELLLQVKVYNYVPKPAEKAYADALFEEYKKDLKRR